MSTSDDDDQDYDERQSLVVERVELGPRSAGTRTAVRTHDNNGEDGGMLNLFLWLGVAVVAALIVYNIQHLGEMEDTAAEEIQGTLKSSSSSSTYINTTITTSNNNDTSMVFTNETANSSTILHFP
jgi:hypothetical protein